MASYYTSPPPAYSPFPPKYAAMDCCSPRSPASPGLCIPAFTPTQPLMADQASYVKAYNRAVAIYNASPRKDYLACNARGCTNVVNNFNSLVMELNLHEIATSGTLCPVCTNWFESWELKDMHMCPGPGGQVPVEDPELPPIMPPVQHMAAADPTFFHQSMRPQQYAIVAARKAMDIRRSSPHHMLCDFPGCKHAPFPTEASLVEHLFKHFQIACGGLCSACKQWCATTQDRQSHKCPNAH